MRISIFTKNLNRSCYTYMFVLEKKVSISYTSGRIPIVIEERPYARTSALAVFITVGSRDEPTGSQGIAHLLEHTIFKGTENMSSRQTSELIEAAGGEFNGYTGKEMTCYYTITLSETVDVAQRILADALLNARLERESIEIEKGVVSDEIRLIKDEPDDYIHHLLSRAMWNGHPMASSEAGEIESVENITESQLKEFYKSYYQPSNFVIAACGDVKKENVVRWAEESFDDLISGKSTRNRIPPTPRSYVEILPRDGEQVYVGIGFPGYRASHPDRFAQTLMSAILGGGTSSRFYQEIREEKGLVYSIYTSSQPYSDCGIFGIFFSAKSSKAELVCKAIADELRKIKDCGLKRGELVRAKRYIKGLLVRKIEPTESRLFHLGEFYVMTEKLPTEAEIISQLEKVTEEDVKKTIEKIIVRDKMSVAIYGTTEKQNSTIESIECLEF